MTRVMDHETRRVFVPVLAPLLQGPSDGLAEILNREAVYRVPNGQHMLGS